MTRKAVFDWLWREFGIFKIVFGTLTLFLIYQEILVFLVVRPTSTSIELKMITPDLMPDIIICPQPGFHIPALRKNGYHNSFWYSLGMNTSETFLGWSGNNSLGTLQTIEDISTLKNTSSLPLARLKMKFENDYRWFTTNFSYTRTMHPLGRCLRVIFPNEAGNGTKQHESLFDVSESVP